MREDALAPALESEFEVAEMLEELPLRRGARAMMGPVRGLRRFCCLVTVVEVVLLREEMEVWESWELVVGSTLR